MTGEISIVYRAPKRQSSQEPGWTAISIDCLFVRRLGAPEWTQGEKLPNLFSAANSQGEAR